MKKGNNCLKIIVDSNIWISFLIGKSLSRLHYHIDSKRVCVLSCREQMRELKEVFNRPRIQKLFSKQQIVDFFDLLEESSQIIPLRTNINLCRDSKDNYLLSLAVDGKADYLITGDNDLLVLNKVENTRIISFRDFDSLINK